MNYQIKLLLLAAFFVVFSCGEERSSELSAYYDLFGVESAPPPGGEEPRPDRIFNFLDLYYQRNRPSWWLRQIKVPQLITSLAHQEARLGGSRPLSRRSPIIAVLDSGVDISHPALEGHIWENLHPGQAGCDNDRWGCDTTREGGERWGSGPALPFATTNFGEKCKKSASPAERLLRSSCLHGTHVAGLIVGDPTRGVDGLCPTCMILPVRVVEDIAGQGRVTDLAFLRALRYLRELNHQLVHKIKIVNLSFGKFQWSLAVARQIQEMQEEDYLFIAAAGNENVSEKVFPASLPGVVAVTAVDHLGRKSSYANFGSWVNIAAPGGNMERASEQQGILSAAPGGEYSLSQGTSVASPLVAAAAGLLLSLDPDLSAAELRRRLLEGADGKLYEGSVTLGANAGYYMYDRDGTKLPLLGTGLLNVEAAWKGASS
jgi:subtilisin family serine protease